MAKAKAAPKIRETYSGYSAHLLAHSSPRKVPTARATEYATLKLPLQLQCCGGQGDQVGG